MTPLVKTEALVMRCVPFSNTSMIVSWLTPEHGLVATMIKGAQRPKSLFLGQYDLFYTCELIYYDQPNVELYTARECTPLQFRPRFRTDWRAMCLASYLVYLTGRVSPPGVPHPALYQLLSESLNELNRYGSFDTSVYWFELKLLGQLGLTPRLTHCTSCNRPLKSSDTQTVFSEARGGICCLDCVHRHRAEGYVISANVLGILQGWQRSQHPQVTRTVHCTKKQIDQMHVLLGNFLHYHLEDNLSARYAMFEMIRSARHLKG